MNAARSIAPILSSGAIPLDAYRPVRHPLARTMRWIAWRDTAKIGAVFAACVLGLIGSFADGAVARSGLLLIGAPDDTDGASVDTIAATLAWATIADLAVCAGIVLVGYCLLSLPSAQIVELHPRRRR